MKKQLLTFILTAGCIPAIIEQETQPKKDGKSETVQTAQAVRKCVNCRRK